MASIFKNRYCLQYCLGVAKFRGGEYWCWLLLVLGKPFVCVYVYACMCTHMYVHVHVCILPTIWMYFSFPPCCGRTENCTFHCSPTFVKFFSEGFHIIWIRAILWSSDLSKGPESGKALKTRPVCRVVVREWLGPLPTQKSQSDCGSKLAVLLFGEAMLGCRHEASLQEQTWSFPGSVCFHLQGGKVVWWLKQELWNWIAGGWILDPHPSYESLGKAFDFSELQFP